MDGVVVSDETFYFMVFAWGFVAVVSAVLLFLTEQMPISSKKENTLFSRLGTIDKKTGWMIMETPILLTTLHFFRKGLASKGATAGGDDCAGSVVIVACFLIHYTQRALIYPQRIQVKGKTMSVFAVMSCTVFYLVNGFLIGHYFGAVELYPRELLSTPRFICATVLFFVGFIANVHCDSILINLRKPGETCYKIPRGFGFDHVTCPHYFAEIVEWTAFALMSCSSPAIVYALWVNLPLLAQAMSSHKWYKAEFKDKYPDQRKAVIPFIL